MTKNVTIIVKYIVSNNLAHILNDNSFLGKTYFI